jgi:hypothetical protein
MYEYSLIARTKSEMRRVLFSISPISLEMVSSEAIDLAGARGVNGAVRIAGWLP